MKRWKAILAASLIFAMGAATGALAWRAAFRATGERRDGGLPPMMLDGRFNVLERMEKELVLSPEQSRRIAAILDEGRKCTKSLWDSVAPQMKEESKRVRDRIRAELTAEQREKYEDLIKRSREKRGAKPEAEHRSTKSSEERSTLPSTEPGEPKASPP